MTKPGEAPFARELRELADTGHVMADELRAHADALDALTHDDGVKKVLGVWARARKCWTKATSRGILGS